MTQLSRILKTCKYFKRTNFPSRRKNNKSCSIDFLEELFLEELSQRTLLRYNIRVYIIYLVGFFILYFLLFLVAKKAPPVPVHFDDILKTIKSVFKLLLSYQTFKYSKTFSIFGGKNNTLRESKIIFNFGARFLYCKVQIYI